MRKTLIALARYPSNWKHSQARLDAAIAKRARNLAGAAKADEVATCRELVMTAVTCSKCENVFYKCQDVFCQHCALIEHMHD